jgi:polyferredoxin
MSNEHKEMKSIWYLVGLMLLAMGAVITVSGAYHLANPPDVKTVLGELHADFWWGLVMLAVGAVFFFGGRNRGR